MPAAPARLVEALADRYRIERELGAGGMATVWLAEDLKHHRKVAIKVLRPELASAVGAERFLAEIRIIANLQHPHILGLIDSGEVAGCLYYAMPFVEGESLRARLTRETQLPIDDALRIASDVGSAIDYAHRHNIVHRDIKPENILLHEGGALVADFGIALALQGARAERLTETGVSIGTPLYMSPEQATGERALDARSDIYSLGVVLYEMLAGEPPFTGPTSQAIVAKLLSARPARLRVVRSAVPPAVDAAVDRALEKVPADRFATAGEMLHAIRSSDTRRASLLIPFRLRSIGAALGVVALTIGVGSFLSRRGAANGPSVTLHARTQITSTGLAQYPSLSADGRQVAYVVQDCVEGRCRYAIDVQDVGSAAHRRIARIESTTSVVGLKWSADQRHFVIWALRHGEYQALLVAALGGLTRPLPATGMDFSAGGDSVLLAPTSNFRDRDGLIRIAALDGVVRDSFRTRGTGNELDVFATSSSRVFVVATGHGTPRYLQWFVVERNGQVSDSLQFTARDVRFSSDAAWFLVGYAESDNIAHIVRVPLDLKSGRFGAPVDTVYSGRVASFDITPDGRHLVVDEISDSYNTWITSLKEALQDTIAAAAPRVHASSPLNMQLSPDGTRLLLFRPTGDASGTGRLSWLPATGGPETPLPGNPRPLWARWTDSVTLQLEEWESGIDRLSLMDIRTGARREMLTTGNTSVGEFAWLRGRGWAWLPAEGKTVAMQAVGEARPHVTPREKGAFRWDRMAASTDGQRLALVGSALGRRDSLWLRVLSPDSDVAEPWAAIRGSHAAARWLADGSVLWIVWDGGYPTLYRVRAPGSIERIGTIHRPTFDVSISEDLRVAALTRRDHRSDVWLSRVEKR